MSTAADIITPAQDILNDANVRWPTTELLRWVSQGMSVIAMLRPDATATTQNLTLVAGTRQTLPSGSLKLRIVERELLDLQGTWHTETAADYITNFAYDERIPAEFWCYPPANAGVQVQASVSMTPAAVTATTDALATSSIFDAPLMDFLLFRAFQKEDEAGNQARATSHFQMFALALGQEAAAKIMASPNKYNLGGVQPKSA